MNRHYIVCSATHVSSTTGPTPALLSKTPWKRQRSRPPLRLDRRKPIPGHPRWTSTSSSSRALQVLSAPTAAPTAAPSSSHNTSAVTQKVTAQAARSNCALSDRAIRFCLWHFPFQGDKSRNGNGCLLLFSGKDKLTAVKVRYWLGQCGWHIYV